jgi:hypothetical protein
MPYVALAPAPPASAAAAADARWARLSAERPDLGAAIALQRQMVQRLLELSGALQLAGLTRVSLPPGYLAAKLKRGVPALSGERLPIPVEVLGPALPAFCDDLGRGGAGEPAFHLRDAFIEGRLDPGSVLSASLGRHQQAIRAGALQHGFSPDLLWLIAELAVSPFAHALQVRFVGAPPDPRLVDARDTWTHGYCLACGSWPALAEVLDARRVLRCSFCALAWEPRVEGCVYCGHSGAEVVRLTPDPSRADQHVEACGACRAYLKMVDLPALSPFPLTAISDLESSAIDADLMARGFGRPALREFTAGRPT